MRDRTWKARRDKLLREEMAQPEAWWWLSFADENGFKGGIFTRARGIISAVTKTHTLGISPGGEVKAIQMPDSCDIQFEQFSDRLLSKEDLEHDMGGVQKF